MPEGISKATIGLIKVLASTKTFLGFWLTMISVLIVGYVAIMSDPQVVSYLPLVLGVYFGSKTIERGSAHWAASKDGTADTAAVIEKVTRE